MIKRRSLINGFLMIAVLAIGVALINFLIQAGCYTLLMMFKYPMHSVGVILGLMALGYIADRAYTKYKK
jgi:hypothetical protein